MKRIELRKLGPAPEVDVREVLVDIVKRPLHPQTGADLSEVRQSLRVLDALARADGTLELEDADWEHLKTKTLAMTWNQIDARVIEVVDAVVNA